MESGREEGEDRGRERGRLGNSWLEKENLMHNLNTALTLIMTLPSS